MTAAWVVETSVTVNNSPIQDYVHPDVYILNLLMHSVWLFLCFLLFFFLFLSGDRFRSVPVLAHSSQLHSHHCPVSENEWENGERTGGGLVTNSKSSFISLFLVLRLLTVIEAVLFKQKRVC